MASNSELEIFGDTISIRRLNPMAQNIAAHINGGTLEAFAGFVWYRPQGPSQGNLHHKHPELLIPALRAAA